MTDKQIIIDGVDVSGCSYYDANADKESYFLHDCKKEHAPCWSCSSMPNCLYKKWQRKEQECEELKEEIKKHNDDMFKNPPEKRFYCKGCTLPYVSKKLKQTLTEIKEIASREAETSRYNGSSTWKQILQKISKCEVK